jgi:hypothetical protein
VSPNSSPNSTGTSAHHGELDFLLQYSTELVVGEQVRGIGHPDAEGAAAVLQHDRPEAPCLSLRQAHDRLGFQVVRAQTDERNVELTGERASERFFADEAAVDENAAEFSTALLLLLQREANLLLSQQILLYEYLAQADLFRSSHAAPWRRSRITLEYFHISLNQKRIFYLPLPLRPAGSDSWSRADAAFGRATDAAAIIAA